MAAPTTPAHVAGREVSSLSPTRSAPPAKRVLDTRALLVSETEAMYSLIWLERDTVSHTSNSSSSSLSSSSSSACNGLSNNSEIRAVKSFQSPSCIFMRNF